jgi:FkbM family methyltransferase
MIKEVISSHFCSHENNLTNAFIEMTAIINCFLLIVFMFVGRTLPFSISPGSNFRVYGSWRFWFPPTNFVEELSKCPPGWPRRTMEALSQKYNNTAWLEFHHIYQDQLQICPDKRSGETIRRVLDHAYSYFHHDQYVIVSPLSYQLDDWHAFNKELPLWRARFPGLPSYPPENFYHHHGLRFIAPKPVLGYISQKDILDVGGSWGDSLIVLKNYTKGRVISYDILPSSSRRARHWASKQCIIVNMGMSDRPGTIDIRQSNMRVNLTTVDSEVERLNLTVGMIKADIEGAEPQMIQGAMRTIMKQRPVLELSIYHSTEIVELPKMIAELGFYEIRYYFGCIHWSPFFEFTLFAYPKELIDCK